MGKSRSRVRMQLKSPPIRWPLLLMALFGALHLSSCTIHLAQSAEMSPLSTERLSTGMTSGSDSGSNESEEEPGTLLSLSNGMVALSQEFFLYEPSKDVVFQISQATDIQPPTQQQHEAATAASIHTNRLVAGDGGESRCRPETDQSAADAANTTSQKSSRCSNSTAATLPTNTTDGILIDGQPQWPAATGTDTSGIPAGREADELTGSAANRSATAGAGKRLAGPDGANSSSDSVSSSAKERVYSSTETPYCLGSRETDSTFNWLCQGITLLRVPVELEPKPSSLRLSNTGIETLTRNYFPNYRDTLRDFSMEHAPKLVAIEEDTFAELSRLRVVYIIQAPKLVSFDAALTGLHPELTIMFAATDQQSHLYFYFYLNRHRHIQQTGLRSFPNLSRFKQQRILNSLDLVDNRIEALGTQPINIRTELLNLGFNLISSINEFTFNGSEIGTLSLSGNRRLSFIHPNAFSNLKNLMKLDLSSTSIESLPSAGFHQLRTLIIRDTYTLKHIPSVYAFRSLDTAHLTYAFHCCSFRYPQTHDPSAYEEHLRLQDELNRLCGGGGGQSPEEPAHAKQEAAGSASPASPQQDKAPPQTSTSSEFEGDFDDQVNQGPLISGELGAARQLPAGHLLVVNATSDSRASNKSLGRITGGSLWLLTQYNVDCGELAVKYSTFPNITCTPEPDAFNPCEDIMGYSVLRVAVWFVAGASLAGNTSVIFVLVAVYRRLSVPKFLQLNLALGDLAMGFYLVSLAMADIFTVGSYFNHAIDWQHGLGCKVVGALSLFASQLSIFTLCVITFERYYTITYSIDLNMRLQLGWAVRIMLVGWLFAFGSALLPAVNEISSYTKTSLCLPMQTSNLPDRVFLSALLCIDTFAFVIIFACYLKMYLLILRQKTDASFKERKIAMRMTLLVCTDFACWAPIIFFGATALMGRPLINVTNSKILIVFFYPLNSMANPFLYVLTTRQYKRDLEYVLNRWRTWRKGLFSRNQDSFYSNNAAYGLAQARYTGSAALNAHLGAVAAVTGVAQLNGGCPGGDRVVCTKTNKGRYIIRHQILTDSLQVTGHRFRGPRAFPMRALERPAPGKSAARRQLPADQTTTNSLEGPTSESRTCPTSKLVNVSGPATTTTTRSGEAPALWGNCLETKRDRQCDQMGPPDEARCRPRSTGAKKKAAGGRLVDRTCNCCCRCYRWSGQSSRNQPAEEQVQSGPPERLTAKRRVSAEPQSRELKSITLLTTLPNSSSLNHGGEDSASGAAAVAQNESLVVAKACPALARVASKRAAAGRRPLRRKCSCVAVDDIFKEAVERVAPGEGDESRCPAHNPPSTCEAVGGSDDVETLGDVSLNEPTSSLSCFSSPRSSGNPVDGVAQRAHQHRRQDQQPRATRKRDAYACCYSSHRCRCCAKKLTCPRGPAKVDDQTFSPAPPEVERVSELSDSNTHLSLSSIDIRIHGAEPPDTMGDLSDYCRRHHRSRAHGDHQHEHHHHRRHHGHRHHHHHHHHGTHQGRHHRRTEPPAHERPPVGAGNCTDGSVRANKPDQLIDGGESALKQVELRLESILKSSREVSSQSNAAATVEAVATESRSQRASLDETSADQCRPQSGGALLRGSSFQSSQSTGREKKRVSIVEHHSG